MENTFKYNLPGRQAGGKELNQANDLRWHDFGARMYDNQLGRWHCADPANQFVSPYLSFCCNPINTIDPDGTWALGGNYYNLMNAGRLEMGMHYAEYNDLLDRGYSRGEFGLSHSPHQFTWVYQHGGGGGNTCIASGSGFDGAGLYAAIESNSQLENYLRGMTFYFSSRQGEFGYWERVKISRSESGFTSNGTSNFTDFPVVSQWVPVDVYEVTKFISNALGLGASARQYSLVFNNMWKGSNGWNRMGWWGNRYTGARSKVVAKANWLKSISRGTTIVTTSISLFELGIALDKGEYGKAAKSGLDATMGWVATCGLPGLIIGGSYFVLDAMGVFSQPNICTPFREIHYYYPQNDNTNIKPYNNP